MFSLQNSLSTSDQFQQTKGATIIGSNPIKYSDDITVHFKGLAYIFSGSIWVQENEKPRDVEL